MGGRHGPEYTFKTEFKKVAEFTIPTGAIASLLKRANKLGFISKKEDGSYLINSKSLPSSQYEEIRDREIRKYNGLKNNFIDYCQKNVAITLSNKDVDKYFFEVLYEIAPSLFKSVSDIDRLPLDKSHQKKYLVSKFISHAYKADQASFEAIESFVRGAMLTETFYYSAPGELQGKMRRIVVYFDTSFLLRAIGLSEKKYSEPCIELATMLKSMGVKMRCFRETYEEIHGILFAASANLKNTGRILPKRPGDIWDYYNSIGAKTSDVELDIAMLEKKLNKIGVLVVERPPHEEALTIDEKSLSEEISTELKFQTESSRRHDIDCLTAIFRLRRGKPQKYLEACDAIFITTNTALSRASTRFFNKNYGVSDAAICMSDQVFTTLVWLKAVKKAPNLPKHRLVANCFAALQPSSELWARYVEEATSLKEKGEIGEEDYAVLMHSMDARTKLMDLTLGHEDIVHGNVRDVLDEAKKKYTSEVTSTLQKVESNLARQNSRLESLISQAGSIAEQCILWVLFVLWYALLIKSIFLTSPDKIDKANLLSMDALAFWIFSIFTLVNMVYGVRVYDLCKIPALKASTMLTSWLKKKLIVSQ